MKNRLIFLFVRYLFLLVFGMFGLGLLYSILSPLTVYPSFFLLKSLYPSVIYSISTNTISLGNLYIEIIEACVASSAYYLFLILNLTTSMSYKKRIQSLAFLLISFLILNIFRIVLFSSLFFKGFAFFNITHVLVWYLGSTLLVVILWFISIYLFKIKEIPFYSDIKYLYKPLKK